MARSFDGGNRRLTCGWACLVGAAWLTVAGCASDDSGSMLTNASDESGDVYPNSASGGASAGVGTPNINYSSGGSTSTSTRPPETEVVVDFDAPQSSENYVYATNPDQDSVAVIHASTLAIQVVQTGDQPRFLRTIPFRDAALLVDVGASDIAYIETASGQSSIKYYENLPSANVIQVAPDGKHAVAYFDVTRMQQGKFETLQDVSVLTIGDVAPVATRMTVGFKARQVTFAGGASGAAAAYVVTDDGISILDFATIDAEKKSAIAKTLPVFTATESKGADISVTPDGNYALGRIEGTSRLRLVELTTGKASTLDLASVMPSSSVASTGSGGNAGVGGANAGGAATAGAAALGAVAGAAGSAGVAGASNAGSNGLGAGGASMGGVGNGGANAGQGGAGSGGAPTVIFPPQITDLDVSPDGKFAYAVSRDRGVLLRVPIPSGFTDPGSITQTVIADVIVGSAAISPNGKWAVLYTTAVASERRIVIVDLVGTIAPRALDLSKAIKGVTFSSSGDQAYVAHNKSDGLTTDPGLTTEQILDRSYGYTLVDLGQAFRKLVVTESDPALSVTTPLSPYVFLSFAKPSTTVQRLDMESLQVSSIVLGSAPISLGVVPAAQRVFVNQDYPEGRLTFIDWATLDTKTVTGYELNSKIRE